MKFSKKSEYGLRALLELTLHAGKRLVQRHEIGASQRIPVEFLEHILLALKRAGLITSHRGVHGGYALIKSPSQVTMGQVIRVLDGPLAPIGCVSVTAYQKCADCPFATTHFCPIQHAMGDVRDAIAGILDHYTLEQFASGIGQSTAKTTPAVTAERRPVTAQRRTLPAQRPATAPRARVPGATSLRAKRRRPTPSRSPHKGPLS